MSTTQFSQLCNGKKQTLATDIEVVMGVGVCPVPSFIRILTDILALYLINWLLRRLKTV